MFKLLLYLKLFEKKKTVVTLKDIKKVLNWKWSKNILNSLKLFRKFSVLSF